jgi:hypothetical protein
MKGTHRHADDIRGDGRGGSHGGAIMTTNEEFVKLHVDLPNHWATGGETLWARQLGEDLYELRDIPFYSYGLNLGDVVQAVPPAPHLKPQVLRVVRRSGHRTLRIVFQDDVEPARRLELINSLKPLGVGFQSATRGYFALDLLPQTDAEQVCQTLDGWQARGWIEYETCEAQLEGSFDVVPEDPESESG